MHATLLQQKKSQYKSKYDLRFPFSMQKLFLNSWAVACNKWYSKSHTMISMSSLLNQVFQNSIKTSHSFLNKIRKLDMSCNKDQQRQIRKQSLNRIRPLLNKLKYIQNIHVIWKQQNWTQWYFHKKLQKSIGSISMSRKKI